jgi:hypothetical protein
VTAAQAIATRFPIPPWFAEIVLDDLDGDIELAAQWLEACSLSGRYIAPASLQVLRLSIADGGWKR